MKYRHCSYPTYLVIRRQKELQLLTLRSKALLTFKHIGDFRETKASHLLSAQLEFLEEVHELLLEESILLFLFAQ